MNTVMDELIDKWPLLRGELRKRWPKITDEDWVGVNHQADELVRVLQQRYGYGKVQAGMEINKWLHDYGHEIPRENKSKA